MFFNGLFTRFLQYINEFPDAVICHIAIYADDTAFYSNCDQASNLRQLASELESNLRETVDCSRKWLADFNAGKTQLVLLEQSNFSNASICISATTSPAI